MKSHRLARLIPALALLAAGTGCSVLDTKPAPDSGFNPSTASESTRAAFLQKVWVDPAYHGKAWKDSFSAVYVAPVNISYLEKMDWWQQQNVRKAEIAADARALADRMQTKFQEALANYPGDHLAVVGAPGPGVLTVELALVELVPSKAFWNAGVGAAGFVVPGAGFLSAFGSGCIAMEGRLRGGPTNGVIAVFKDRREDKIAPVNLANYTWYRGAEENINDWAAEGAQVLNSTNAVKRPSRFRLNPW
jgi:hypothetical protein